MIYMFHYAAASRTTTFNVCVFVNLILFNVHFYASVL